tara:strand:+ start:676 stop:1485 length:810 start_codon:yes stop_codon:yes gene_type:complete
MKILELLKNPKTQRNLLLLSLVIIITLFKGCGKDSSIELMEYKQNVEALQDSIRTYKTNNGDLVSEKMALLTNKNKLEGLNKDLFNEVKNLRDNPIVITKVVTKIIHDTLYLKPKIDSNGIVYNSDSTIKITPFTWSDSTKFDENNYRNIGGEYLISVDTNLNVGTKSFKVTKNEIGMSFTTGITESDDDKVEIFLKSDYPGFIPTKIDGTLFNPTESDVIKKYFPPKRWGVGFHAGYGVYVDPIKFNSGTGFNISVGISYNIIQWKGR